MAVTVLEASLAPHWLQVLGDELATRKIKFNWMRSTLLPDAWRFLLKDRLLQEQHGAYFLEVFCFPPKCSS